MNDPLNEDLSNISTSLPLLAADIYDLKVEASSIVPTSDGSGRLWKLELATIAPAPSSDGEQLGAGVRVFNNCSLQPSGKATQEMVLRNVASIVQSAGLTGVSLSTIDSWHNQIVGKVLRCKVKLEAAGTGKNGKEYPAKNSIGTFLKK